MASFYTVSVLIAAYLCSVAGQNSCKSNEECKSLYSCEPLMSLVQKKDRTQQDVERLQKSKCGFLGNVPKVCCPNTCRTPEGIIGECINIHSCKHLKDMLKAPAPKENLDYVQNSKCPSSDHYSVCCGPPPSTIPTVTSAPVTSPVIVPTGNCTATVSAFPPDLRSGCCGVDSRFDNRIIGGEATTVDQYPWMVLVEYVQLGETKLLCGGGLISGKYVLTAAHCVTGAVLDYGTPKRIRLGEYDTDNVGQDCTVGEGGGLDCTDGIVIIPIEKTIPHPKYNPRTRLDDIALIRMRELAPRTDFIRPICLPTIDHSLSPPVNFSLFVAGWGAVNTTKNKSNIKLHVQLPYENMQKCQAAYKSPGLNADLWNGQLCAGGQADKDSCKGDSGGPLMFMNGRTYEMIGVVSFGPTPCGLRGVPGVYTKVFQYLSWINSNIQA